MPWGDTKLFQNVTSLASLLHTERHYRLSDTLIRWDLWDHIVSLCLRHTSSQLLTKWTQPVATKDTWTGIMFQLGEGEKMAQRYYFGCDHVSCDRQWYRCIATIVQFWCRLKSAILNTYLLNLHSNPYSSRATEWCAVYVDLWSVVEDMLAAVISVSVWGFLPFCQGHRIAKFPAICWEQLAITSFCTCFVSVINLLCLQDIFVDTPCRGIYR